MPASRFLRHVLLVGCSFSLVTGCGVTQSVPSDKIQPASSTTSSSRDSKQSIASDQKKMESAIDRIYQAPDGTQLMKKDGLFVSSAIPFEGPASIAWEFFEYQGDGKYDDALSLLTGFLHDDLEKETDQKRLREVVGSKFVRWADLTPIMVREKETMGAYDWRVIYIEVNLEVRGTLPKNYGGFQKGLNHFALHMIQAKQGDPWKIVLLGGSPQLEE